MLGQMLHLFSLNELVDVSQIYASELSRIRNMVPDEGLVSILKVTDKQFGDTIQFVGRKRKPPPPTPLQLELF